jgi:hypothetical protein
LSDRGYKLVSLLFKQLFDSNLNLIFTSSSKSLNILELHFSGKFEN